MPTEDNTGLALWEYHRAKVKAATGVEPTEPPTILDWMNEDYAAQAATRTEKGEDNGSITDKNYR